MATDANDFFLHQFLTGQEAHEQRSKSLNALINNNARQRLSQLNESDFLDYLQDSFLEREVHGGLISEIVNCINQHQEYNTEQTAIALGEALFAGIRQIIVNDEKDIADQQY